jgi:uncharacterized protein (TIGR04255 family)
MARSTYPRPPLIEALCEIYFDPGQEWDVTLLGLYYERVKSGFPGKRELRNLEVSVQSGPEQFAQEIREAGVRMQFVRADKTAMVQVAPNLLVVNQLPPYPSWAEFRALISERVNDYVAVAKPQGLARIGLRYINRFNFTPGKYEFARYFARAKFIPPALFEATGQFLFRLELAQAEQERLLVTMASAATEPSQASIVLDLDHVSIGSRPPDTTVILAQLDAAHDRIETVFEDCLTDDLRRTLGKEV